MCITAIARVSCVISSESDWRQLVWHEVHLLHFSQLICATYTLRSWFLLVGQLQKAKRNTISAVFLPVPTSQTQHNFCFGCTTLCLVSIVLTMLSNFHITTERKFFIVITIIRNWKLREVTCSVRQNEWEVSVTFVKVKFTANTQYYYKKLFCLYLQFRLQERLSLMWHCSLVEVPRI